MSEFRQKFVDRQEGFDPRDGFPTPDDLEILAQTDPKLAQEIAEEVELEGLEEGSSW